MPILKEKKSLYIVKRKNLVNQVLFLKGVKNKMRVKNLCPYLFILPFFIVNKYISITIMQIYNKILKKM